MTLKTALLWAGVAAIPAWYIYRTITDHRIPRLEWNEIFMTQDDILRKRLKETQENARKEIDKAQRELAVVERRKASADGIRRCLELSKTVREEFHAVFEEQGRWKAEVLPILSTRAGGAITANEDYIRAFREFTSDVAVPEMIQATDSEVERIAQGCEQYSKNQPVDLSTDSEVSTLERIQQEHRGYLRALKATRSKILILSEIANGQAPQTLEVGIQRQKIRELIENYKWQREREKMFGHP